MIEFVKLVSELLLESVNQRPNVTFVGKFFVRSLHCLDFPVLFISFSIYWRKALINLRYFIFGKNRKIVKKVGKIDFWLSLKFCHQESKKASEQKIEGPIWDLENKKFEIL